MLQYKAADGSLLNKAHKYDDVWNKDFPITSKLDGFVGFDISSGKVLVITSAKSPVRKIRIGKFLKRAKVKLSDVEVESKTASNLYKLGKVELKFTTTSEEVLDVYARGSRSCMRGCDSVAVYATDDVCVAYLEHEGSVLARAVVSKLDGLQYYKIYGEKGLMQWKLQELGAVCSPDYLEGAKVLHLTDSDGCLMMPYLDGHAVDIETPYCCDEFVTIVSSGDISCQDTCGRPASIICSACSYSMSRDEEFYGVLDDETYCEDCFLERHVYVEDAYYSIDDDTVVETGDDGWCLREDTCYVEQRDEWHPRDNCSYNTYTEEYILKSDLE